jgi:mono/diheme cytochrome c family protein
MRDRLNQTMNTMKLKLSFALAAAVGLAAVVLADDDDKPAAPAAKLPPPSTKTGVTYAADIKPIFDASCVKCHDGTKPRVAAKLALDTLEGVLKGDRDGKVVIPGDSAKSDLVLAVAHVGDPDTFMPKGRKGQPPPPKLSDEQIGLIRAWIDQGAK